MKAVVIEGPGRLAIVEKAVPLPGRGEVLIKISYCSKVAGDFQRPSPEKIETLVILKIS